MSTSDSTVKFAPPHMELTSHPALKISGVEPLKAPGEKSNYLDWSVVLEIHFNVTGVGYIIETLPEGAAPTRRPTQAQDNLAICSVISRTVKPVNLRYIRLFKDDAKGMWEALKEAHQDSSSGGRMYWLRKLTTARMTGDDVDAHIDQLQGYAERLNTVVTSATPLTPDDIHATSLLNSLPSDWHPCVSALMNKSRISSIKIVSALRQESLRRKACLEEAQLAKSVARANVSNDRKTRPPWNGTLFCTFCNANGHDLSICENAARILSEHKQNRHSDSSRGGDRKRRLGYRGGRPGPKPRAKADNAHSSQPVAKANNAVATPQQAAKAISELHRDANLNSGCTNCMTPYVNDVLNLKPDNTPIRLADHSTVEASHRGTSILPLNSKISVPTLVVPNLHEPLLSIAAMCDAGLTCVFNKDRCEIYELASTTVHGDSVGEGYRKGNLYFLPSNKGSGR